VSIPYGKRPNAFVVGEGAGNALPQPSNPVAVMPVISTWAFLMTPFWKKERSRTGAS
jgi:hypothetical protein